MIIDFWNQKPANPENWPITTGTKSMRTLQLLFFVSITVLMRLEVRAQATG